MEIYGGNPPKYHTSALLGTPRIHEWEGQLANYIYRTINAAEIVAKRVGVKASIENLYKLRVIFEKETGCGTGDPKETIKKLKLRKNTAS